MCNCIAMTQTTSGDFCMGMHRFRKHKNLVLVMHLVHELRICCRWSIIIIASMCCISVLKATRYLNQTSFTDIFQEQDTQKCSQQRSTCRGLPQSSVALGEDHTVLGTLWLFNTGFCWNEGLLSLIGENLIMGKEEKDCGFLKGSSAGTFLNGCC